MSTEPAPNEPKNKITYTCIFPSKNYEESRGKEYIDDLLAEKDGNKVIPCILHADYEMSDTLKKFYSTRRELVVEFDKKGSDRSISEIARADFIRAIARILNIAINVPHSVAELYEILQDEPALTDEERQADKTELVVYMEKFMREGNEEEKNKLDLISTLVLAKELLEQKKHKELEKWITKASQPSDNADKEDNADKDNADKEDNKWGCSIALSDLIITHDPKLAGLGMIVYTKSKLPKKNKIKKQKDVNIVGISRYRRIPQGYQVLEEVEPLQVEPASPDATPIEGLEPFNNVFVADTPAVAVIDGRELIPSEVPEEIEPLDETVSPDADTTLPEPSTSETEEVVVDIAPVTGINGDELTTSQPDGIRQRKCLSMECCKTKTCEVYDWVTTPNHKCSLLGKKKRVTLSFKAFVFLVDLVTDIIFTVDMFLEGENALGGLSIVFIVIPLVVGNRLLSEEVSFQLTTKHKTLKNKWLLKFLNILQLKPMVYCIALLTHRCGRMWVTAKNFYDYTRIRYLERMTENIPETILQAYVISTELFNIAKLNTARWQVISFSNINRVFSLVLSLILFPKAIVDKECWARKSDYERYDFCYKKKVCLCKKGTQCCPGDYEKCRFCRIFTSLKVNIQTPITYIIYLVMITSRLLFFALFFMALNTPDTKLGKYNATPVIIVFLIFCLKFIYYCCIGYEDIEGKQEYSFGIRQLFSKIFPNSKRFSDAKKQNIKLCFVKTYTQVFIPNNGLVKSRNDPKGYLDLHKSLLVPHCLVALEMCALNIFINFFLEDKLLGIYSDVVVEYLSITAVVNTLVYCFAVMGYCTFWWCLHPDITKEKSKWKKLQEEECAPEEGDKEYLTTEIHKWGCNKLLNCDYKSKNKKYTNKALLRKEEMKAMNCCKAMFYKAYYWCYDPLYDDADD